MLGADLPVLGAWDGLALLGVLGWVGRGIWLCWVRWAGLGVGFGWAVGADLAFCVWSTLYISFSCLHNAFVIVFTCISVVCHGA